MGNPPHVKIGQRIEIGTDFPIRRGIVSHIHKAVEWADRIEVVYLDHKGLAVAEDMHWNGSRWEFVVAGPSATYADNSRRLKRYADILYAERSALRSRLRRPDKRFPR